MIDRIGMMRAIVDACPGFAASYDAFIREWGDTPEVPYYLALADFSRYLIAMLESGRRPEFDAVFATIERLYEEGDEYVREAVTIGILENLQNTNLHSDTTPGQVAEFLRPTSLRFWRKVEEFWEDGTPITDV